MQGVGAAGGCGAGFLTGLGTLFDDPFNQRSQASTSAWPFSKTSWLSCEVQSTPLTYFELERNLGMFGNLLGTVLGSTHILTSKYREFRTMLSQCYRLELQKITDNRHYIKPAHLLRSIQLQCYNWFYQHRARLTPIPPNFTTMLHNIILNTYSFMHTHLCSTQHPLPALIVLS